MRISAVILLFFVWGCSSSVEMEEPSSGIERNKFTDILVDVNLLEAHLSFLRVEPHQVIDSAKAYYFHLFAKHGITKREYEESLEIYSANPVFFQELQQEVLQKLQELDLEYSDVVFKSEEFQVMNLPDFVYILVDIEADKYILMDNLSPDQVRDSILLFVKDKDDKLAEDNTNFYQFKNTLNNWVNSTMRLNQLRDAVKANLEEKKKT